MATTTFTLVTPVRSSNLVGGELDVVGCQQVARLITSLGTPSFGMVVTSGETSAWKTANGIGGHSVYAPELGFTQGQPSFDSVQNLFKTLGPNPVSLAECRTHDKEGLIDERAARVCERILGLHEHMRGISDTHMLIVGHHVLLPAVALALVQGWADDGLGVKGRLLEIRLAPEVQGLTLTLPEGGAAKLVTHQLA